MKGTGAKKAVASVKAVKQSFDIFSYHRLWDANIFDEFGTCFKSRGDKLPRMTHEISCMKTRG